MLVDLPPLSFIKSSSVVGVDISNSWIRLVELSRNKKESLLLKSYAAEKLPSGAIIDGDIAQLGQVIDTMRRLWKKCGSSARHAAIALASENVMISTMTLNTTHAAQIEKLVIAEVEQRLGHAIAQTCMDFSIIATDKASTDTTEVLAATSAQDKIEDRLAVMESVGLTTRLVDISSYAAYAALLRHPKALAAPLLTQGIALLHMKEQHLHVSLLMQQQLVYEQTHPWQILNGQADDNESAIHDEPMLSLAFPPASQEIPELLPKPAPQNIVAVAVYALLTMQSALTSRYPANRAEHVRTIGQIFVAGHDADDLSETLTRQFNIPAFAAAPFAGMQLAVGIDEVQLAAESADYLIACGLAVRLLT